MKKYAFGVDIGGTSVKIGFFETNGNLLETWEIPTRLEDNGGHILEDIKCAVEEKCKENQLEISDLEGIGMGIPGPVGQDGTVYTCINLGWPTFNVVKEMESIMGCKVRVGNDANVAALGEMWQGGGKGHHSIVMVTLGTGVGGGVIINDQIVCGFNGAAGEIGHILTKLDETECCACGNKGCLEQYASANGLVKLTKKYLKENNSDSLLRNMDSFTTKDICSAAKDGDEVANLMIDTIAEMLGRGCALIGVVVNPEAFIIGGGLSNAGSQIIDPIQKYYKQYAFYAMKETSFKKATLGNLAGIYGAVKLILE